MEKLKALELAIELYCCLKRGGGGGGGVSDYEIAESLGIEYSGNLLDMLNNIAEKFMSMI